VINTIAASQNNLPEDILLHINHHFMKLTCNNKPCFTNNSIQSKCCFEEAGHIFNHIDCPYYRAFQRL
jgi:hypothetical protein